MEKKQVVEPMNQEQVKSVLKFIDATQPEEVKRAVFSQLGRDCFECSPFKEWLPPFEKSLQTFLDEINLEHKSRFWESLVFSEDHTQLILTGRVVTGCVCAFADVSEPPLSLCHYCCKHFQETYFKALLGREVEVEITAAFMLGDERCNTVIKIL